MSFLLIETLEAARKIRSELDEFCEKRGLTAPATSLEFEADAITDQILAIKRLLVELAPDDTISDKTKSDLAEYLASMSLSLKRSLQGQLVPTELTGARLSASQAGLSELHGIRT